MSDTRTIKITSGDEGGDGWLIQCQIGDRLEWMAPAPVVYATASDADATELEDMARRTVEYHEGCDLSDVEVTVEIEQ